MPQGDPCAAAWAEGKEGPADGPADKQVCASIHCNATSWCAAPASHTLSLPRPASPLHPVCTPSTSPS